MSFREAGDVIALDQRGTGMSVPNLNCPGNFQLPLYPALTKDGTLTLWRKRLRSCANYWEKKGIDLAGYNTNESADDLETLRQELGVRQIRLWGISYGTHLALATIKRHESSIQSAILAGVEGPDDTLKLPAAIQKKLINVDRLIRADPQSSNAVPDLLGSVRAILKQLKLKPVTETVQDPRNGNMVRIQLNDFDLETILAKHLDPESLPYFPQAFFDMAHGNFQILGRLALSERTEGLGSLMSYAVDCASGVSQQRWIKISRQEKKTLLGRSLDFPYPEICDAISVPDLGTGFRTPVRSKVRVLLISGTLDQRTPIENAKRIAGGFPNSTQLIIVNGGHDDLFQSAPLIEQAMLQFLHGIPLSENRIQIPPIQFLPVNTEQFTYRMGSQIH